MEERLIFTQHTLIVLLETEILARQTALISYILVLTAILRLLTVLIIENTSGLKSRVKMVNKVCQVLEVQMAELVIYTRRTLIHLQVTVILVPLIVTERNTSGRTLILKLTIVTIIVVISGLRLKVRMELTVAMERTDTV